MSACSPGPIDRGLVDVALSGLSRPQKTLPAKLFYDEEGCRLFYRITELPEYYLTRTERALLPQVAPLVLDAVVAAAPCWWNTAPATRPRRNSC